MIPRRLVALALAFLLVAGRPASAEDAAAEEVKAALVAAAEARNSKAVTAALDRANSLVGPQATFPDAAGLADWLGELPKIVTRLVDVQVRRAWLYVSARKGADAVPILSAVLAEHPENAAVRGLRGEAKRQAGDFEGAADDLVQSLADGAPDTSVIPSAYPLVFEVHEKDKGAAPEGDGLPRYAVVGAKFLAARWIPDVAEALRLWLAYDAEVAKADAGRSARLRAEAIRVTHLQLTKAAEDDDFPALARQAYEAAQWRRTLSVEGLPERFDLLAFAVRFGDVQSADKHTVPQALVALAEEALARGRYVLASRMARRRLAISDSPAARRVLLACPPDIGE